MTIMGKVASYLSSDDTEANEPMATQKERDRARLYECDRCSSTFISGGMDSCPGCGESVDRIPTERDLGML